MWIVEAYDQSQTTSGGLRSNYYVFVVKVYHPICPELQLGYGYSYEQCFKLDGSGVIYGGNHYSHENFKEVFPQIKQETIDRALKMARENLAKLKLGEDYDQYKIR